MARVHALGGQRSPAPAVWLPAGTFDRLEPRRASELRRVIDDYDLHMADFRDLDGGDGGHLLTRDEANADRALARHRRGAPVQDIVADLTGSGRGSEVAGMRTPETAGQSPGPSMRPGTPRGSRGRRRGSGFTPAFEASQSEAVAALERELKRMLPRDIALQLLPGIRRYGVDIAGEFQKWEGVVRVALSDGTDQARIKGVHEVAGHALRSLYTEAEWKLLVETAKKVDAQRFLTPPVPGLSPIEGYRKVYTKQARQLRIQNRKKVVEESLEQEHVAGLAEMWASGEDFGQKVNSLLARILRFLEAVRNALRGLGFQNAEDIFERVASGEVAARRNAQLDALDMEDADAELDAGGGLPRTDLGKTLRTNTLDTVWRALEAGQTEPRRPPFPADLFLAAKAERDKGRLRTREEFDRWAETWKGKGWKLGEADRPTTLADWLSTPFPWSWGS
jgi:hypothetical protein